MELYLFIGFVVLYILMSFFVNKNVKNITNYYTIAEKREKVKKVNIVTRNVMFPVMSDEIEYQYGTKL